MCQALRHFDGDRYELAAFAVMDDHVHTVVTLKPAERLSAVVHSWKTFAAHQIQKSRGADGSLWQDEYFDRIVRSDREYSHRVNYVLNNPFMRWPDIDTYPWIGGKECESDDCGQEGGGPSVHDR